MPNPFPIPLAIMLSNGSRLATPDPAAVDIQVLRNDGSNEPQWGSVPGAALGTMLTADPAAPTDGTYWVVYTGTSPTQTVALKGRISGVTVTIASITR